LTDHLEIKVTKLYLFICLFMVITRHIAPAGHNLHSRLSPAMQVAPCRKLPLCRSELAGRCINSWPLTYWPPTYCLPNLHSELTLDKLYNYCTRHTGLIHEKQNFTTHFLKFRSMDHSSLQKLTCCHVSLR